MDAQGKRDAERIESLVLSQIVDRATELGYVVTSWKHSDAPDPLGEGVSMALVELTRVGQPYAGRYLRPATLTLPIRLAPSILTWISAA